MIASVRGRVAALHPDGAVVEVGGVGLFVSCAPGTLARLRLGEPGTLATSLVVREDSLTLYGFGSEDERSTFELLQTASGVGPRLAQAVLAVHSPAAVRRAVATEDLAALTLVSGIGRKGAQRMVLELKDRLAGEPLTEPVPDGAGGPWREQLRGALIGLGWSAREADEAVAAVAPEADAADAPDVATLLRSALRLLSRR
ncbi:MAG: Holliday junction branch migration protein RuvA [Mycobacteriales bacterium]